MSRDRYSRYEQDRYAGRDRGARVPGASHLFEELGKLEEVARHAGGWFKTHLRSRRWAAAS